MNELLRRLTARPLITVELLVATFFANLLALASPLFVIQVLNRYVSYGIDATLITLTGGVVTAIVLEMGFRQARMMLAGVALEERDEERALGAFGVLTSAKVAALESIPVGQRREIMRGLDTVETTFNAPNMTAVLDVPFAMMFVVALFLLNSTLGLIATGFIVAAFAFSLFSQRLMREPTQQLAQTSGLGNTLVATADRAADTLRAFGGHAAIMSAWNAYVQRVQALRRKVSGRQGATQTVAQSLQALMSVAIIAAGAILVVTGKLDVGLMIGANILAARGLGPIQRFAQMTQSLAKAKQALADIRGLSTIPLESDSGSALGAYSGAIEFRDVAFAHPGQTTPLFESLNLSLAAGSVLIIQGNNGTGKTTLMRMIVGLIDPVRGQIFADGVEIRQLAPAWWRRQIVYLPQEPVFLNGPLVENLRTVNPEMSDDDLSRVIRIAGLGRFIDESPEGLETPISDNGQTLALGIRRRIALARALASNGRLVVFDEPTESLDSEGCAAVYGALKVLAEQGRTIIVVTRDPVILGGARIALDLNSKPAPTLVTLPTAAKPQTITHPPPPATPAVAAPKAEAKP